jgi:hypothetical protein
LTPDFARYFDQLVDGKPDAREGRFRMQNTRSNAEGHDANKPGEQWAGNNTIGRSLEIGTGAGNEDSAEKNGRTLDEDRVALLTAHWSMDQ